MPKISVIIPTHNGSKYLLEAIKSVQKQTYTDWEIILVLNNGGISHGLEKTDKRIKVFTAENKDKSVGRMKRFACEKAKGEIYVELDSDDLLMPTALEEVVKAFEDPEISQVYSDFAEFFYDHAKESDWKPNLYGTGWGWEYNDGEYKGHPIKICRCFEPVPSSFTMIWFAPNHIRAWRATHYWEVGGHDAELPAVDDFDLELRLYMYGKFKRIPKCLYLYRITGENTWIKKNAFIQRVAKEKAEEYHYKIIYRWSELQGWKNLKIQEIKGDLNKKWDIPDNSIGVLKAWDRIHIMNDPQHFMNEAYRVLVPGGWLLTSTPSTDGRGAFMDPRTKSYWNENSFDYYTKRQEALKINNKTRFQEIKRKTYFPNKYCEDRNISYVMFEGIALKEGMPRLPGWKGI